MLDDVERGRFLVEPAREDALEAVLRVAHIELDERAGELLHLPGGGGLARTQADDHVAETEGLPRLERDVPRDPVALVEQAEHRHPLGHRRRSGRDRVDGLRHVDSHRLRLALTGLRRRRRRVVTRAKREQAGRGCYRRQVV
jgi:hypothetical protein